MNKERLLDCADILETVDPDKFDMHYWWIECGTAGCAIGWYCKLRNSDLKLENGKYPTFRGHGGFDAIAEYFVIDYSTAIYLFASSGYNLPIITPLNVATKIRRFVESQ